jgi:magnesium-transporting ATPase (P-type)
VLVPGDVVFVKLGDVLPADIRVLPEQCGDFGSGATLNPKP